MFPASYNQLLLEVWGQLHLWKDAGGFEITPHGSWSQSEPPRVTVTDRLPKSPDPESATRRPASAMLQTSWLMKQVLLWEKQPPCIGSLALGQLL